MAAAISHHLKDVAFGIESGRGLGENRPVASVSRNGEHIWMGAPPRRLRSMLGLRHSGCGWGGIKQDRQIVLFEPTKLWLSGLKKDNLGLRPQVRTPLCVLCQEWT